MIIITSGQKYSDIDIVASALAYKNLCDLQGIPAKAVLPGPLNESVTKSVSGLLPKYETELTIDSKDCEFILVDISDPKHFANFVNEEKIVKLYDHRFWGKELYWKEKLGNNAVIESVGACATLIWEEFIKTGVEQKIDKNCANLIYMDIVIHTLNLQSLVATERDKNALNCLKPLVSLPRDFAETYYSQVNESFMKDPEKAMRNDTKIQEINSKEYGIIQVELWDSRKFIEDHENPIIDILKSLNTPNTFLTSPSIAEGYNYVVTTNDNVKKLLEKSIGVKFDGNIGRTPKLLLRKEIIKILIDYTSQTPL